MTVISVRCLLVNDETNPIGGTFRVDVSPDAEVQDLKDKIKEMRASILANVDAFSLHVWKLREPKDLKHIKSNKNFEAFLNEIDQHVLPSKRSENESEAKLLSDASDRISDLGEWPEGMLHVIVKQPATSEIIGKRKRNDPDVGTRIIRMWRSKHIRADFPTVLELVSIADRLLLSSEKVPIPAVLFDALLSSDPRDGCINDDVELLFRISDTPTRLFNIFLAASEPPPTSGTEESFISFWDRNVREVIELLVPSGRSMRNSNLHTATRCLRPDYGFLLHNICPFRGEEKSFESTKNPKKELAEKFVWVYDPAPYVLGYYAKGSIFTLVAISPPPQGQRLPVVQDIVSADLRFKRDRIQSVCRLINLAGFFESLARLAQLPNPEFEALPRDNGTLEIAGRCIVKRYTGLDKFMRIVHLESIYKSLKDKKVPHVDSLVQHYLSDAMVILSPRGIARPPISEEELLSAVICVLEALEVLHQEPPIFHRDIRWSNVMRCLDDPLKWFIIDWEDAAMPPTTAQHHFKHSTHSPRVFVDGHGTEVDIWGVGGLIIACEALGNSLELQDLGKWMQGSAAPSAQDALAKIKEYQLSTHP